MALTLEQILKARDERQVKQRKLMAAHPSCALVVTTIVAPGADKRTAETQVVAAAAEEELRKRFGDTVQMLRTENLETGYEAYLLASLPEDEAKRIAVSIEDEHPLGRLMDIDVISGRTLRPLNRSDFGFRHRRCLLCDNEARLCMRMHTHSQEEVLRKIRMMTDQYTHCCGA